jgi:hypothetical protein
MTSLADTVFCKRYPLTCLNLQAQEHGAYGSAYEAYGSMVKTDVTELDFTPTEEELAAGEGSEPQTQGWFKEEVVDRPMRTAGMVLAVGGLIWGIAAFRSRSEF